MEKIKEANKFNRLYLEEKDHYMKEERQKKEKEKREAEELKQKEQMKKDIKDKYDQNNLIGKRNYNVALDTNNNLKNDNSITVNQNKNQDPTKNNLETNEEVTTLKPYQAQFMESIRNKINKKISENFEIVAEAKLEEAEGGQTQKRFKLSRKKRRIAAKKRKKELEEGNHKARIGLLHQTAFENDRRKKKKQEMFGWNVFNEDAKYNAYKKRLKELVTDKELFQGEETKLQKMKDKLEKIKGKSQNLNNIDIEKETNDVAAFLKSHNMGNEMRDLSDIQNGNSAVLEIIGDKSNENEARLDRLVETIHRAEEKRKKFQRRRPIDPNSKVTYVNDRNRVYNDKLSRYFGTYVKDVESKLARGGN